MSEILLPMFSTRIYVLKSFIHFVFILMYGASWWSSFLFLRVLSFYFVDDFLCCAKMFYSDEVSCVYFFFFSLTSGGISNNKFLWAMSQILLPMFSSRNFMVLGLTLTSLIHFKFILECGIKRWSSLIFLHISVQFSHTIYWKTIFSPLYVLASSVEN